MNRTQLLLVLTLSFLSFSKVVAQNPNDPVSYGNQALLFGAHQGQSGFGMDAATHAAYGVGLASFLENPATLGLLESSYFQTGFRITGSNEQSAYLGSTDDLNTSSGSLGSIGFAYKIPTTVGSFVVGAAYHQQENFGRGISYSGQNNQSTLTDQFKLPNSTYADIAFNTYVTDVGDTFGDWDESIFRSGFDTYGEYLGVFQQGEDVQNGHNGEYAIFMATEFQKNFMVGFSLGVLSGTYSYKRIFQELDRDNLYTGAYIDSDGDSIADTDMSDFVFTEGTETDFDGFRGRVGLMYTPFKGFRSGISYTLPSKISVNERFDGRIFSTFDNGVSFDDAVSGSFEYAFTYPGRVSAGLSYAVNRQLTLSLSSDIVNYSNLDIDFKDETLFDLEQRENGFISENFSSHTMGYRFGLMYQNEDNLSFHGGYGYKESALKRGEDPKQTVTIGASLPVGGPWYLDLGLHMTFFNQQSILYNYGDYDYTPLPATTPDITIRSQEIDRETSLYQFRTAIRFNL